MFWVGYIWKQDFFVRGWVVNRGTVSFELWEIIYGDNLVLMICFYENICNKIKKINLQGPLWRDWDMNQQWVSEHTHTQSWGGRGSKTETCSHQDKEVPWLPLSSEQSRAGWELSTLWSSPSPPGSSRSFSVCGQPPLPHPHPAGRCASMWLHPVLGQGTRDRVVLHKPVF